MVQFFLRHPVLIFLTRFQAGGGYSGAAYKKSVYVGYKMIMLCMIYFFGVTIFVLNPFLLHSIDC